MNIIHERIHKKYTAAIRLKQVFGICRIRYLVDRKAGAMIANRDLKSVRYISKRHFDRLSFVKFIPVLDGIRNRFPDRKVDGKDKFVAKPAAFCKFVSPHRCLFNRFDPARQCYFLYLSHNIMSFTLSVYALYCQDKRITFVLRLNDMKLRSANSVRGMIILPGDKSISHRAAMFAAIADGETRIENFSRAVDCHATLNAVESIGVRVERNGTTIIINGVGKTGLTPPSGPIDCGNSGTTIRLLSGILAGQSFDSTLTGDESLAQRPMKRIIDPLIQMGAKIDAESYRVPIKIFGGGKLIAREHELKVASAQVKSCILLAGLNADGRTTVVEPVETRDHTERMLRWFGVEVDEKITADGKRISVDGHSRLTAKDLSIPADISSAAFFLVAAACLPGSQLTLPNVGLNRTRRAIIEILRQFGAAITIENERIVCNEPVGDLIVKSREKWQPAGTANVVRGDVIANLIDEIPILAVFGTQIEGGLEVRDAAELRVKESDRIASIVENLRRMGADVEEFDDGFRVSRSRLKGAEIDSFGDHRIAMAFAVAALFADGETDIGRAECADISFPGFFETLVSVVV